jgi:ABC-type transport system involved in multi-copper enzyme maturation permease subunit
MLKIIIEKELKDILGSTKFIFTFAVCSILILLTFYVGARSYQINKSQYEVSVAENIRNMQDLTSWQTAAPQITLPPMPIAALVSGVSNDIGRNIYISGFGGGELRATNSKYNEELIYAVFRFLDLDFLFQVILSLFAILFAFNAVNGEKERGTLALTFANPVPRDKYILGKLIGSFLAIAVPLLIPMLLGSLLLPLLGVPMNAQEWVKLLFVILTGFLYFGVFLSLSVLMSIIMKQSAGSFLMMLVIWILSVVIVPRASVEIAGRAISVPSNDELNSKKSRYQYAQLDVLMKKMTEIQQDKSKNFTEEYPKIIEEMTNNINVYADKLNEERTNKQNVQKGFALGISRISPSACFSLAASNIAGTSLNLVDEYMSQAKNYRNVYKNFQNEKIKAEGGNAFNFFGAQNKNKIDVKELPQFVFVSPSFSNYFSKSLVDLLVLIIYNIIFFVSSFVAFIKYDLR